ncbi:MAG: D-alanyl-D-alanine carboxypeptidase [Armatimonadetes bacterium]|nr:D-alanyl-D-alanine carboxypeptidase [Armatimonadota bacterium]
MRVGPGLIVLSLAAAANGSDAEVSAPESGLPEITAESAVVMDADSGAVLFEKNAGAPRYPASTTKILTALLLIENCSPDEVIMAPLDSPEVTGSSLHLKPAEGITAEDALYALLVRSANDVAHAVARHISGSEEAFAELMNSRAEEIGCRNTYFINPHGLHHDQHVTTAYDMALIACEAMRHERFRDAAGTRRKWIERSLVPQDRLLISRNRFLNEPGAEGIKTGFTSPAGRCFVGSKSLDGWRVISVVLSSEDWLADTNALFDWTSETLERRTVFGAGDLVGAAPVKGGARPVVRGRAERDVRAILFRGGPDRGVSIEWRELKAPVLDGDRIGTIRLAAANGEAVEVPVLAAESVARAPFWRSPFAWAGALGLLIGVAFAGHRLLNRA